MQFVDTNVLVYAHDSSAGGKHKQAKALVQELWHTGMGCLSVQVLQEFYVTVTQKVKYPLELDVAAGIVENLSFWKIYVPDSRDVLGAIDLKQHYMISFWDAMIVWSAAQLDCRILWSEDLNSGQVCEGVRLANPFEFDK
jgi:predicted nucleic acid-binding protein